MACPSSPPTDSPPPTAMPLPLPPPPPPPSSRRLPPPCWSHDETVDLIDAYSDKWYSLGRGNLKATHWQEVADAVTSHCPDASPPKAAVQCRHKMEKLRKRYRAEIQRARSMPVTRFNSSWVHFKRMDSMEKGPCPMKPENNHPHSPDEIDPENKDDVNNDDLFQEFKNGGNSNMSNPNKLYRNGIDGSVDSGGEGGFRIRIPSGVSIAKLGSKFYGKVGGDQKQNLDSGSGNGGERSGLGKRKRERDPVEEMVCAIKVLGDGFVRMEQMKMEMVREIETMRMEMETKRTEMILESQQRILEAFANAVSR